MTPFEELSPAPGSRKCNFNDLLSMQAIAQLRIAMPGSSGSNRRRWSLIGGEGCGGSNLLGTAFALLLAASLSDASGMSSPSKTRTLLHESGSRRPAMQRSISGLPEKEVAPLTPQAYNEFLRAASDIKVLQVQHRLLIQVRRVFIPFGRGRLRPGAAPARRVGRLCILPQREPTPCLAITITCPKCCILNRNAAPQEANELKRENLELRRKLREGDLQQKTSNLELMEQNMKLRDENYEMKKVGSNLAPHTLHPDWSAEAVDASCGVEKATQSSYAQNNKRQRSKLQSPNPAHRSSSPSKSHGELNLGQPLFRH